MKWTGNYPITVVGVCAGKYEPNQVIEIPEEHRESFETTAGWVVSDEEKPKKNKKSEVEN
jgi:hypothetical protein